MRSSWVVERRIVNAEVATVMGLIPASFDTVESEERQKRRCWIKYWKNRKFSLKKTHWKQCNFYHTLRWSWSHGFDQKCCTVNMMMKNSKILFLFLILFLYHCKPVHNIAMLSDEGNGIRGAYILHCKVQRLWYFFEKIKRFTYKFQPLV